MRPMGAGGFTQAGPTAPRLNMQPAGGCPTTENPCPLPSFLKVAIEAQFGERDGRPLPTGGHCPTFIQPRQEVLSPGYVPCAGEMLVRAGSHHGEFSLCEINADLKGEGHVELSHTQTSMPASRTKIRTRTKLVLGEHVNHTSKPCTPNRKKGMGEKNEQKEQR